MRPARRALFITAALALAGCSLAPPYTPPVTPTPTAFKEVGPWTPASPADAAPRGDWWTVYEDQTLDDLERKIETDNPDLAAALARYDEARALLAQARAAQYPQIGATATTTQNRQSEDRPLRVGGPNYYNDNVVGGTASYELDLWGRVRNQVAAGKAQAQAAGDDSASIKLSLEAQLADAYMSLRGEDAQAKLLADTTEAYTRALKLTRNLYNGGAGTALDVSRAQALLEAARAAQYDVAARRAVDEHAIAALVGAVASSFSIAPVAQLPVTPRTPVAAPSVLLQRRPDVAAAERRVAAANANIGVARAAFYPSISLDASAGLETAGGVNLLNAANSFWTVGPELALTLFDGGRRKAVVRQARDQYNEAGDAYKSTVLAAFQQVEDNLALCNQLAVESDHEALSVTAAQRSESLALTQYQLGSVTYLDVVTAQTADLQAESAALTITMRRLQASVDLVRALGGGWTQSGRS